MAKKYTPALQVHVTIVKMQPSATQLAAWKRLWANLLASTGTAGRPEVSHDQR